MVDVFVDVKVGKEEIRAHVGDNGEILGWISDRALSGASQRMLRDLVQVKLEDLRKNDTLSDKPHAKD